jgi:hypothetical protein
MLVISAFKRASVRGVVLGAVGCAAAAMSSAAMALTITAPPYGAVVAGHAYAGTPKTSDTEGKTLVFSITKKPEWASFNTRTGELSGTPTAAAVGMYSGIEISVSDGTSSAHTAEFFLQVRPADKSPPTISGTPSATAVVGSEYAFTPVAKDPAGNPMYFVIHNKPDWASFSIATGEISGKPTSAEVGTYKNISLTVNDGQLTDTLGPFSITVKAGTQPATSAATLFWTTPTENTNGTALTDLGGYYLHYGTSPSNLTSVVQLKSAATTSYTVDNLKAATWYFGITAYTTAGVESAMSAIVSTTIP